MSVSRILCTEESLLITLNKILTGREIHSLPVFYLIFSPDVDNDYYDAYVVHPNGDVDYYYWGVDISYGIFISMIYYECDIDILYIAITFYFLEVLKYET